MNKIVLLVFLSIIIYLLLIRNQYEGFDLKISLEGDKKILSIAEIKVYDTSNNELILKEPIQSSTDFGGIVSRAIDNDNSGNYYDWTVTHTKKSSNPYLKVKLPNSIKLNHIGKIIIMNRTDVHTSRLDDAKVQIIDDKNNILLDLGSTGKWDSIFSKVWTREKNKWEILDREIININLGAFKFSPRDYKL
ncbi:MAG: hypothetical protein CMF62_00635 [Magnetococcales bacterium]|nr:hypothetical protein [Magnetococcales bacterium]|tara:strand:- start:19582 stop:20154 length:573 start_codon:yes stop_codon:yes gene_type:complete